MAHKFEIVSVHPEGARIDVRWDDDDTKIITLFVPTDEAGNMLPSPDFENAIMTACVTNLDLWDKIEGKDFKGALDTMKGKTFDVTNAYALRNVK